MGDGEEERHDRFMRGVLDAVVLDHEEEEMEWNGAKNKNEADVESERACGNRVFSSPSVGGSGDWTR